jgi:hypothetical protein
LSKVCLKLYKAAKIKKIVFKIKSLKKRARKKKKKTLPNWPTGIGIRQQTLYELDLYMLAPRFPSSKWNRNFIIF